MPKIFHYRQPKSVHTLIATLILIGTRVVELEFFLIKKNISDLLLFFQFDLEENSSSPGGAVFPRSDIPGSVRNQRFFSGLKSKIIQFLTQMAGLQSKIFFCSEPEISPGLKLCSEMAVVKLKRYLYGLPKPKLFPCFKQTWI